MKVQGVAESDAEREVGWLPHSPDEIDAVVLDVTAGVVNRPTTIAPLPNPVETTRGAPEEAQFRSRTIVFEAPAQAMLPPGGGGGGAVEPGAVSLTVTEALPPSPLTVYVYWAVDVPVFGGIVSVQLVVVWPTGDPAFVHDEIVPQLLDVNRTDPPDADNNIGEALSVHDVLEPGDVQETTMFPLPSAVALKLALVHESDAPTAIGAGTVVRPADATAAASTRLIVRFVCIRLPRKNGGHVCHRSTEQALRQF